MGQISQLLVQFLDITSPKPYILRFREQTVVRSRKIIRPQILYEVVYPSRLRFWLSLWFLMQPGILAGLFRVRVAAAPTLPLFHHGLRVLSLCRNLRGNHSFWRNFGFLRQFGGVLVLSCLFLIGFFLFIFPGRNNRTLLWIIATMYLFGWSLLMSFWHVSSPPVLYSFHASKCPTEDGREAGPCFPYLPSKNS